MVCIAPVEKIPAAVWLFLSASAHTSRTARARSAGVAAAVASKKRWTRAYCCGPGMGSTRGLSGRSLRAVLICGWSYFRKCRANLDVAEPRRSGAVAGAHGLHGLALSAIRSPPERPVFPRADGVATVPELRGDAAVAGVFQHARFLPAFDLPADFRGKLEVIPPIVNGPRPICLHQDGVAGVGKEIVELPGARPQ